MDEPTLEELEELEALEIADDLFFEEEEDYQSEGFESLDVLREAEDDTLEDGAGYRALGVQWDEVED